ncbi:MAG: isoprenyl transferase [Calditrichaeota bacterium]|nr:MAG: isoprenyl transferase [Calditrichota bacterium]
MAKNAEQTHLEELKDAIKKAGNLPEHIAIIMDGNGRWAKSRKLNRVDGHKEGINSVREIVETAGNLGIKYLTLYTFSTENWNRPKGEVTALMALLLKTIRAEVNDLKRNNVKLTTIGRLNDLPFLARQSMKQASEILKKNTGLNLVLALSYSSRQEILDAVREIAMQAKNNKIQVEEIDEMFFSNQMYTKNIPDPDLLIRTSGELRISNFLLWQLAYTEIYVTDVLWPDFRSLDFLQAVQTYQGRERRFGKVSEQLYTRPD